MTLIPISSLANGTIYSTVPFVGSQNPTGAQLLTPAAGQSVYVYDHNTQTQAQVYLDEAGTHPASQPLTTGATGEVPGWVDPSTFPLDLSVSGVTYVLAGAGGSSSGVATVAAADATITIGGTSSAPTFKVASGQFDAAGTAATAVATETARAEGVEGTKAPLASPAFTGTPTAPTASPLTDDTQLATTAYADAAVAVEVARAEAAEALKAPLASPTLTGTPTAPTQTPGDNSTKLATTAFAAALAAATQAAAEAASDPSGTAATAVATEQTRAEAAEATLIPLSQKAAASGVATLDTTGHLAPTQAQVASALKNTPAVRPLKRDILILDNGASGQGASNSTQILAEQFIPDMSTGAMYVLYFGIGSSESGVCIAKASGTPSAPASPDPSVNAFTDLGPLKAGGVTIGGDSAHLVIANNTYFLFTAQNTANGSPIFVYTAPQITSGAIVPLENAVWTSSGSDACYPASVNVTSLAAAQGGAGSLTNVATTWAVAGLDHDGLPGGLATVTFTPTASSEVVLTWTASATGETNGYAIYQLVTGSYVQIATVAHGTATYTVTGSESHGAAHVGYTSTSCARLDEPFVFYDNVAGQWRMLLMGYNAAGTMEQVHLANLSSAGYAALTSAVFSFVKQNATQPVLPAGNYAAIFGVSIPGGSGMATLYDYECVADPFVFQVGSYFVIGYSAGAQGAISATNRYRVALAYTQNWSTFTKLGIMHHPSAAKNPADATNGAALDARGQNRACVASWRGTMYVDANGIGHMPRCAKLGNTPDHTQAYYYQYDLSGITDAILGLRNIDPWQRVEAESTDARLTLSGFASLSAVETYFSGGGIGGAGGKCRYTTNPGDSITFTFLGQAVRALIGRISTTGTVTITLDGGGTEGVNQFTNIDLTSDVAGTWTTIFAAQFDGLAPGVHQLKITATAVGSTGVFVDAIDYVPLVGLPA